MSTRDPLLLDLYNTQRDRDMLALVGRFAPILRFDEREPFLPLAAGYTIFSADGPSPSMERTIQLRIPGKPPAAKAIEYAIWWDWDIHHLYELEHVWIYLDDQSQIVRVEASWHGEYHDIPVQLEVERPVLLSQPGKHAFAPSPDWFRKRALDYRRIGTLAVAAHASVLINNMFAGKIRRQVFDQTLVRSFLVQQAFEPSWIFSKAFSFQPDWLVPWPVLKDWIPRRVNTLLERLENTTLPSNYRALRVFSGGTSMAGLQSAARAGAEGLFLRLFLSGEQLRLDNSPASPDIEEVTHFCQSEPVVAVCQPDDLASVDRLAGFVRQNELQNFLSVTSPNADWLARYKERATGGITTIQLTEPDSDPIQKAQEYGAQFIQPRWENLPNRQAMLSSEWVKQVHQAGLGIVSWPVGNAEEFAALQRSGVDVIWQEPYQGDR